MDDERRLTAMNVLDRVKTRTELRDFVFRELPGWEPWLTLAAVEVQRNAWDAHLLKTEGELIEDICSFAAEFVAGFGAEADRFFLPFAQCRPDYPLGGDLPASEAFTRNAGDLPFSHADLGDRVPSRGLIGLIGALGLRQRDRKSGRPENRRLTWALDRICTELLPFVDSPGHRGSEAGERVAPEEGQRDPSIPPGEYRQEPVTMTLAAVVAIYLSLPNRGDHDAGDDPEQLAFSSGLLKETTNRLRRLAREHEAARAARGKSESFDPEQLESGKTESQVTPVTGPLRK
jgi:hypothetical protein